MICVLIAEDKRLVRRALCVLLARAGDIECVGEATDGLRVVEMAAVLKPDVITMDVRMPRLDGIRALEQILGQNPAARVLMVASAYEREVVEQAMQAGARGFLAKVDMFPELVAAVQAVSAGECYFSAQVKLAMEEELPC